MAEYVDKANVYKLFDGTNGIVHLHVAEIDQIPAADVVPRGVYDQIKWERDMAMQQLEECGIPFGSKVEAAPVARGRWVLTAVSDVISTFMCSECGREVDIANAYFRKPAEFPAKKYPYCNCGARMDKEEENK